MTSIRIPISSGEAKQNIKAIRVLLFETGLITWNKTEQIKLPKGISNFLFFNNFNYLLINANYYLDSLIDAVAARSTEDEIPNQPRRIQIDDYDIICTPRNTHPKSLGQIFTPVSIQSVCIDPDTTLECLTVAVLLPSVVRPSDVDSLHVLEGGLELEIKIVWPEPFYNATKMHKKWLYGTPRPETMDSSRNSHFKRLGFHLSLKSLKTFVDDKIESVGRICLVVPVLLHYYNFEHLGLLDSDT